MGDNQQVQNAHLAQRADSVEKEISATGGEKPDEEMGESSTSYADTLRSRLAHAPIRKSSKKEQALAERLARHEKVEPELVAATTHLGQFTKIHPTRATPGETLPEGVTRSSSGFLIKTASHKVALCKEKVQKEMEYYQKRVIIAYLVGGRFSQRSLQDWVAALSKEVQEDCRIRRELSHGFFQLITKQEAASQKILMLTPHLSKWETCILQPWIPSFNSSKPTGTKMPIWITLKAVPDEFISNALEIAQSLGTVLGKNRGNPTSADQRFCIAVQTWEPFVMTVGVENPVTGEVSDIQVDYNNFPIRCRFCLSTSHLIRECRVMNGGKRHDSQGAENGQQQQDKPEGVSAWVTPRNPANLKERVLTRGLSLDGDRSQSRGENPQVRPGSKSQQNAEKSGESEDVSAHSAPPSTLPTANDPPAQTNTARKQNRPSGDTGGSKERQGGSLNWQSWSKRERDRGYASPPLESEFMDPAEFAKAQSD